MEAFLLTQEGQSIVKPVLEDVLRSQVDRAFRAPVVLDTKRHAQLRNLLQQEVIPCASPNVSAHPLATSLLVYAETNLYRLAGERLDFMEIGPNPTAFIRNGNDRAHACMKLDNVIDSSRVLSCIYASTDSCRTMIGPASFKKDALSQLKRNYKMRSSSANWCFNGAENCHKKHSYAIANHSLYDITHPQLHTIFQNHGIKVLDAYMHLPTELVFEEEYEDADVGYRFKVDGDKVVFNFLEDESFSYIHDRVTWSSYLTTLVYSGPEFNLTFDIKKRFGPMVHLRITRSVHGGTLHRRIDGIRAGYVTIPDVFEFCASMGKFQRNRMTIKRDAIDRALSYMFSHKDEDLSFSAFSTYLRSLLTGLKINNNVLIESCPISAKKFARISISVYVMALIERYKKTMGVGLLVNQMKREQGAVQDAGINILLRLKVFFKSHFQTMVGTTTYQAVRKSWNWLPWVKEKSDQHHYADDPFRYFLHMQGKHPYGDNWLLAYSVEEIRTLEFYQEATVQTPQGQYWDQLSAFEKGFFGEMVMMNYKDPVEASAPELQLLEDFGPKEAAYPHTIFDFGPTPIVVEAAEPVAPVDHWEVNTEPFSFKQTPTTAVVNPMSLSERSARFGECIVCFGVAEVGVGGGDKLWCNWCFTDGAAKGYSHACRQCRSLLNGAGDKCDCERTPLFGRQDLRCAECARPKYLRVASMHHANCVHRAFEMKSAPIVPKPPQPCKPPSDSGLETSDSEDDLSESVTSESDLSSIAEEEVVGEDIPSHLVGGVIGSRTFPTPAVVGSEIEVDTLDVNPYLQSLIKMNDRELALRGRDKLPTELADIKIGINVVCRAIIKNPPPPVAWKTEYVMGGPGCGKTTWIKQTWKKGDLVICSTREMANELRRHKVRAVTYEVAVHELMHNRFDNVFIDEFCMIATPYHLLYRRVSPQSQFVFVGDRSQNWFHDRHGDFDTLKRIDELVDLSSPKHAMLVTHRCPQDVVHYLRQFKDYLKMETTNAVKKSIYFRSLTRLAHDTPDITDGKWLCFTQADKLRLTNIAQRIKAQNIAVAVGKSNTIMEIQGQTYPEVNLFVSVGGAALAKALESQAIVAVTRHQQRLVIWDESGEARVSLKMDNPVDMNTSVFRDQA